MVLSTADRHCDSRTSRGDRTAQNAAAASSRDVEESARKDPHDARTVGVIVQGKESLLSDVTSMSRPRRLRSRSARLVRESHVIARREHHLSSSCAQSHPNARSG